MYMASVATHILLLHILGIFVFFKWSVAVTMIFLFYTKCSILEKNVSPLAYAAVSTRPVKQTDKGNQWKPNQCEMSVHISHKVGSTGQTIWMHVFLIDVTFSTVQLWCRNQIMCIDRLLKTLAGPEWPLQAELLSIMVVIISWRENVTCTWEHDFFLHSISYQYAFRFLCTHWPFNLS